MTAMNTTHTVRALSLLLVTALLVFAGCGKKESAEATAPPAADKAAEAAAADEAKPAEPAPAETAEDKEPIQPTSAELETYTKEAEKEITAANVKDVAAKLAAEIEGELGRVPKPASPRAAPDEAAKPLDTAPAAGGEGR